MIANLVFNRDPAALAHYACKEEKQAEVLVAHGVRSWSAEAMAADFEAQRAQRPKLGRCMLHVALAWPAEEQARLTNDLMRQLAREYLDEMGIDLKTTQWALIRHGDRNHPHAHLLINRVTDTGTVISDAKCYERSGRVCRQLERQHRLLDAAAIGREQQVAKAAAGGLEAYPAAVAYLSEAVHRHLPATSTALELARALTGERVPISMHCTYDEQQHLRTVVFEREGHFVKSSRLSRELSGPKLEKHFTQQRQAAAEAAAQEQQRVARLIEEKEAARFKEVLLAALAKRLPEAASVPELIQVLGMEQVTSKLLLQPGGQLRELVFAATGFPGREIQSGELAPEYSGEALATSLARQAAQRATAQRTAEVLLAARLWEEQQAARLTEQASQAEGQGDYGRAAVLHHVEIPATETRRKAYQALLETMPAGQLLLQQAAEQAQQLEATRQAAEQAAAAARQALRAQLLPVAQQALVRPFQPDRETWQSWLDYTAQVEKEGFRLQEVPGLPPQLLHVASGECFDLAQVQPGGPTAPSLRQQVAEELRAQGAAQTQAERMLEGVLASRNFTSDSELTEQLRALGYPLRAEADNRHWLCHEASGRQFRLAELRPNGLPLGRQVQEIIASRQTEWANGRISVWAEGSVAALERASAMQQRLEAAGAQVFLDYIPHPNTGRAVVLGYRHALRGPQLDAVNHELRLIQAATGTLVREQDSKVPHQPVDKWTPREGEFGQVTLLLHDHESRQAMERAADARQRLQHAGAFIRTVTTEPGGAVALEIGYHSRQPDLPALSQLLDKWRTIPSLQVRETAAAQQARGGKVFLSPAAPSNVISTPMQEAATSAIDDYEQDR
jgi:hypothetical protein